MGRLERPRFGVPDGSWQAEFKKAFAMDDYPRAMAILHETIERDAPNVLSLLEYIAHLGDETEREEAAWVDLSDLPVAFGETIRWTMDLHLAVSLLQNIAAIVLRKPDEISEPDYSEQEELVAFLDVLVDMHGFEAARDRQFAASFDAAAKAKGIVERMYREAISALDEDDPISSLLALGDVVEELSPEVERLRMAQIVLQETARWVVAS